MRSKFGTNAHLDFQDRVSDLLKATDNLMKEIHASNQTVKTMSCPNEVELIYLKELTSKLFHELTFIKQQHQDKLKCELLLKARNA